MRQFEKFIKSTKIISRILFFVWAGYILLFFLVSLTDALSSVDFFCTVLGVSSLFLFPAAIIEYKKNPIIAIQTSKRQKPFLSHNIWGIILLEISPFVVMGGILGLNYSDANERIPMLIPLLLGLGLFVIGILLISGFFTKVNIERAQKQQGNEKQNHAVTTEEHESTQPRKPSKNNVVCQDSESVNAGHTADVSHRKARRVKVQTKKEAAPLVEISGYNPEMACAIRKCLETNPELIRENVRLKAVLKDLFPLLRKETTVIGILIDVGCLSELSAGVADSEFLYSRYMRLLEDDYGIESQVAHRAISTCIEALKNA